MNHSRIQSKPGQASAEKGEVMLDGPNGVAVSMTADAARKMSKSLSDAADDADRQAKGKDG